MKNFITIEMDEDRDESISRSLKMDMKKIYISGPITGVPDFMERFHEAESRIRTKYQQNTVEIINPARLMPQFEEHLTYAQIIDVCLSLLSNCDAIYMMRGWKKSTGACIEYGYAKATNKTIIWSGDITENGI